MNQVGPQARRLGSNYVLQRRIGRGASGEVWRARDLSGSLVAIKVLRPELALDRAVVHAFVQEREVLASLRHPHIVRVRDLVVEGRTLAIVMDLVSDHDLRTELSTEGTLPPAAVAALGSHIAAALDTAHRRRVVHRDVKPENVLIDVDHGQVRALLSDFGVAALIGAGSPGMVIGTLAYLAPETVDGSLPTAAADLYSLGVTLYELACGVTPFAGATGGTAMMLAHVRELPGRPPEIPDLLWDAIACLLLKAPDARPASAGAIARRLAGISERLKGHPAAPPLSAPPATSPISGSGWAGASATRSAPPWPQ